MNLTLIWGMIELGFLAALQAVIGGSDSRILHHIRAVSDNGSTSALHAESKSSILLRSTKRSLNSYTGTTEILTNVNQCEDQPGRVGLS